MITGVPLNFLSTISYRESWLNYLGSWPYVRLQSVYRARFSRKHGANS